MYQEKWPYMVCLKSCTTVQRIDKFILVDVYLTGCPPKYEAVIVYRWYNQVFGEKKSQKKIYEELIILSVYRKCYIVYN